MTIATDIMQVKRLLRTSGMEATAIALDGVYFANRIGVLRVHVDKKLSFISANCDIDITVLDGQVAFKVTSNKVMGVALFSSRWLTQRLYALLVAKITSHPLFDVKLDNSGNILISLSRLRVKSIELRSYIDQSISVTISEV